MKILNMMSNWQVKEMNSGSGWWLSWRRRRRELTFMLVVWSGSPRSAEGQRCLRLGGVLAEELIPELSIHWGSGEKQS